VSVRVVEVPNQTEGHDRHFIEVSLQTDTPEDGSTVHLSTALTITLADNLFRAADLIEDGTRAQ
jgi:hypothetical protein